MRSLQRTVKLMAELLERVQALEISYEDLIDRLTALEAKSESLQEAQEKWLMTLDKLENTAPANSET